LTTSVLYPPASPPPTDIYPLSLHDALPIFVVLGIADHGHRAPAFSRSSDHAAALRTPSWGSSRSLARASTTWGWARNGSSNVARDRKSTRLNSSHLVISYAVFCLKKKTNDK